MLVFNVKKTKTKFKCNAWILLGSMFKKIKNYISSDRRKLNMTW